VSLEWGSGWLPFTDPVFRKSSPPCDAELLKEIAVPSSKLVRSAPSTILPFVVRTVTPGRGSRPLSCPDCRAPLNLIQPDEAEPTRLLGTCESCSKWAFLVELEPDWKKVLLVELPDADALGRAMGGSDVSTSG
jgi:hypothetical protein